MATLVFPMNVSLDGYVDHEKFSPGLELFNHFVERVRGVSGIIYGRGLYEVMRYWDEEQSGWEAQEHAFAEAWRRQPKWVVSRTLKAVGPNAILLGADFESAIRKLKVEVDGQIDVGGPKLAASLAKLGLIDEYQLYLHPVVLGGGNPYFAEARPPLRLLGSERVGENALRLSYAPV